MQRLLAFGGLIILFIVFSLASPFFLTSDNIGGILLATAVNGVLALGVTFVIINGGIDLSVGTVMTFLRRHDGAGHDRLAAAGAGGYCWPDCSRARCAARSTA